MSRPPSHYGSVHPELAHPPTLAGGLAAALVAAVWVGFELLRGLYAGPGMEPTAGLALVALQVVGTPFFLAMMSLGMLDRSWREYGLAPRHRSWGMLLATAGALGVLHLLWGVAGPPEPAVAVARAHATLPFGLSLAAAVIAAQELLARGFLLNELARLIGGRWLPAVILLAVVLGLGHSSHGWPHVGIAMATHLLLGLLYLGTGRDLALVVLVHIAAAVLHGW
jgi:membrane protease YdiL (CAAX protease family)